LIRELEKTKSDFMQQLERRNTCTPRDASLVPCYRDHASNKEETLSVHDLKTRSNIPKVNPRPAQGQGLQPRYIFVINMEGNVLMPTKPARARRMLQSGKARVIKRMPFTIQLLNECENHVQEVMLGIDTGYGNIGFSAISGSKELIAGAVILDNKTKERLDEKRMYRRGRRNKLWYRQPRFLNRTRKAGWLPPSIERRYQAHLSLIKKIKALLPVSKVIIEVAKFDIQKLENPDIEGNGYQQGDLYNYQNTRSYLLAREKGICEHCGKDFKNAPSHVHHRKPRNQKGNNRLENFMLVHETCHGEIHEHPALLKKYEKASVKEYKQSTFMNIINKRFYHDVENLEVTCGNITFVDRNDLGLEKSHVNDAFVISGGRLQERTHPFIVMQKHRNNRVMQLNRKGFTPSIKRKRSIISPLDIFWVKGKEYTCKGMFNKGKYMLFGNMKQKEYFNMKLVDRYYNQGSLAWNTEKMPDSSTA